MTAAVTPHLSLRTDASPQVGTGHAMRCLALAQAWRRTGGRATFLMAQSTPALEERLRSEGVAVVPLDAAPGSADDARRTAQSARDCGSQWLMLDGYHFSGDYQKRLQDAGLHLLVVDDYAHADDYVADLVLNQNIYAHPGMYPRVAPDTRLLLGTRFVLLRQEFLAWQGWQRQIPAVAGKLLVTLGGSDPLNVTARILEMVRLLRGLDLEVAVVVGGSNPHRRVLADLVAAYPFPVRLLTDVHSMPELLAWADAAVTAGGTTCWEAAFLGLPSLVVVLADNQRLVGQGLQEAEAAVNLGWHDQIEPEEAARTLKALLTSAPRRASLSGKGRELVDGQGCTRVLQEMVRPRLYLRVAAAGDCRRLWEWANDPEARAASYSSDPIAWESHCAWFQEKLADSRYVIFIAETGDGIPVGQIRFEVDGREAILSTSVAATHRGQGFGREIIRLGTAALFRHTVVQHIHAFVKENNPASRRVFAHAGYREVGQLEVKGQPSRHFIFEAGKTA